MEITENKNRKKKSNIGKDTKSAWIFILPGIILLGIFVAWPIIYGIPLAFTEYSGLSSPKFIGLANFKRAFTDPDFITSVKNSLLYLIIVPLLQLLSIVMAVVVNQKIKGIKIFRAFYFIPVVTSTVAVSIIWSWLLSDKGLINKILMSTGIIDNGIGWLTSSQTALFTLMFITLWKGLGYYMMIYLAGLQSIPQELLEAAQIDGANSFKSFFAITLPLLKPQIALCSLMSLMGALRVFDEPFVLTKGGPGTSTLTSSLYIYQQGFGKFDFGYSAALGLIISVLIMAISLLPKLIKKFAKKEEY